MNRWLFMLADVEPGDIFNAESEYLASPRARENLIMMVAIVLAIILATIFAVVYQKKKKRRHHHHHHGQHSAEKQQQQHLSSRSSSKRRRKKRRHHVDRPMNPTLAQTGGLPPLRRDEAPPWDSKP